MVRTEGIWRGLLAGVVLLAAAAGQAGGGGGKSTKKAVDGGADRDRADNGAGLYSLAIAEFERSLPEGFRLQNRLGAIGLAGVGMDKSPLVIGGKLQLDESQEEAAREAIEATVLARSLFAQAATRKRCRFAALGSDGAKKRDAQLRQLRDLVHVAAQLQLEDNPAAACQGAVTLLHYCRQLVAADVIEDLERVLRAEGDAVALLQAGLEGLRRTPKWRDHRKRYVAVLDRHEQTRFRDHDLTGVLLKRIPALVELHRARLRDVHMHVDGGFDQQQMCRRLQQIVERCMDVPERSDGSLGKWLGAIERRLETVMPKPADDASVTDKATYGMAQLVLPQGAAIAGLDTGVVAKIKECRAVLALDATKRRRGR